MAAFNNPRFFASLLASLDYFYKNPRLTQTFIKVDNYSIPITKKGAIKLLHSRVNWIKGKPLETDQDYKSLFELLHERVFVKNNYKVMIPLMAKEITGHSLDSAPIFEQTDPELHQLENLPASEQHQAFENWVEKNTDKPHAANLLSEIKSNSIKEGHDHQEGTIHEPSVDYQSPLDQPSTNPKTGRRWLTPKEALPKVTQGVQRVASNKLVQDAIVEAEIATKTKAQPWVFRTVKSFGGSIVEQIPILSPTRAEFSIPRGGSLVRSGFSGARTGATTARVGGLLLRAGAPAVASAPVALIIAAIVVAFIIFFMIFQHGLQNNAICTPNQPCGPLGAGGGDDGTAAPSQNLVILKEGPPGGAVSNGSPITYNITVTYKGTGVANVDLFDKIPADTKFSSATPSDTAIFERKDPDTANETLVWHLGEIRFNESKQVSFTVTTQKADFYAINQASANGVVTGGAGSGQGLLCVADVDSRLVPFFEQSAVAANLSPALMYAVAKGEHWGAPIKANSLDGKDPIISPCGAHGIMQIQHPNDGRGINYGPSCAAIGGTSNPPESWNPLVQQYNAATGGRLRNVDADEDNIWGSSFFVRYFKINNYPAFRDKGPNDVYTDQEIVQISIGYLGAYNQAYANFYLNSYKQAIAAKGTCGGGT